MSARSRKLTAARKFQATGRNPRTPDEKLIAEKRQWEISATARVWGNEPDTVLYWHCSSQEKREKLDNWARLAESRRRKP
ncbi:hypothetical protein [Leptolyngbya sp. GGD]|uniref:hypothetical protein n=1 Tax=Leptolyngbya sp. GGD TaxID=2997907 RepID=UPI00227C79F2|nr:hypothetical protein [Leptolyngbya sp. GGD]MCY6493139.1 hypothetical protein [Leptolyngbya sp. GGD]